MVKVKSKFSANDALTPNQLNHLIENAKDETDKFILTVLGRCGLRSGELLHMRRSWVHVDDDESKIRGNNYIEIPIQVNWWCRCEECQIQKFISVHLMRYKKKYKTKHANSEWFLKVQKKFYKLKKGMKIYTEQELMKYIKEHKLKQDIKELKKEKKKWYERWYIKKNIEFYKLKSLPELKRKWEPKSTAGAGKVPVDDETSIILKAFFEIHKSLGMKRRTLYNRVAKYGLKILPDKNIYPHMLRATRATILANSGMFTSVDLKTNLRWANISVADSYVQPDVTRMFDAFKKLNKKE